MTFLTTQKYPLTQVDIIHPDTTQNHPHTTLTSKIELENCIIKKDHRHSLQSLDTQFLLSESLKDAINPTHTLNKIQHILNGHPEEGVDLSSLSNNARAWVTAMKQVILEEIHLDLSLEDFKKYFKHKKEGTASSPFGRHMGHYKTMVEAIRCDDLTIPTTILAIAHTSLLTSSPLKRWQFASQVILEEGKGRFIEHLGIVQLCEADLNFVLHVIWGKHLMHHAISNYGLDTAQYAIPGQMCNNAILNKLLFLDLS